MALLGAGRTAVRPAPGIGFEVSLPEVLGKGNAPRWDHRLVRLLAGKAVDRPTFAG